MAIPTEEYEWAESAAGDRVVEPVSQEAEGWIQNQAPPSTAFNWIQRMIGRWIGYFRDDINIGRSTAVNDEGKNGGYWYENDFDLDWYLHPIDGGFHDMDPTNPGFIDESGTPSYVRPTTAASTCKIRIPLKWWFNSHFFTVDPTLTNAWAFTGLAVRVKGDPGSSTIHVRVCSATKGGARVVERDYTITGGTFSGSFQNLTDAGFTTIDLINTSLYWVEVDLFDNTTETDVGICWISLTGTKTRVE